MTEEQIRAIVRDEVEEQLLKEGGILDQCRQVAFAFVKSAVELQAKQMLDMFAGNETAGLH